MKDIFIKILDFYPIWFIRSLFCKHYYIFYDNIYGDEIIDSGNNRSKWVCTKCEKIQYRKELVKDNNGKPYPSRVCIEMIEQLTYK